MKTAKAILLNYWNKTVEAELWLERGRVNVGESEAMEKTALEAALKELQGLVEERVIGPDKGISSNFPPPLYPTKDDIDVQNHANNQLKMVQRTANEELFK